MKTTSKLITLLADLEERRGHPVLLCVMDINNDVLPILNTYLHTHQPIEYLDVVLSTSGGTITAALRIGRLLRAYVQNLTIFVPDVALSAGTLICLCANEIVFGTLATLSPIDPQNVKDNDSASNGPLQISSEDIRIFRHMAKDWFGITREEDYIQVLALVTQRFFPTVLSTLYRSEQMVHHMGQELLSYQLIDTPPSVRQTIVEQLISGYYAHTYPISCTEAQSLGLKARDADVEEKRLLWEIAQLCDELVTTNMADRRRNTLGLITSTDFSAQMVRKDAIPMSSDPDDIAAWLEKIEPTWEIDTEPHLAR